MTLTKDEYDSRKCFLGDLKLLAKSEKEEIYRILKRTNSNFSENSNGIFFDVVGLQKETFEQMQTFILFCKTKQSEQAQRVKEMENFREDLEEEVTA